MKKTLSFIILFFVVIFLFTGCRSAPEATQGEITIGGREALVQPHGRQPILAILPFIGGEGGDGETIATLLSFQREIENAFTVVPRTAALDAIFAEHAFQLDGLTDADTIAGIGRMLNAEYVLSGNIRRLGGRNLILSTIIHVESFQQVAGYHRTYNTIEEVRGFLPSMARNLVATALRRDTGLPNLAILPLEIDGISAHDAETLAKILAIEIINIGNYAVLPRTSAIEAAQREMGFQMWGYTTDEGVASLGQAFNATLALAIGARRLGGENMFTAQILNVMDGSQLAGYYRIYQVIADATYLMAELAVLLTEPPGPLRNRRLAEFQQAELRRQEEIRAQQEAARARQEAIRAQQEAMDRSMRRAAAWRARIARAGRNEVEFAFAWIWEGDKDIRSEGSHAGLAGAVAMYWSPLPYISIGGEGRFGGLWYFIENDTPRNNVDTLISFAPTFGLVVPLGSYARILANAFVEAGQFGPWEGLIEDWLTPGFDAGIALGPFTDGFVFSIRYRHTLFQDDVFTNDIRISAGWRWR